MRNPSIDILKFLAALLITNSHMEQLYHPYEYLSTGGAIGDVLFFFCSGFTLFLGRMDRFDNWYKRRINRIYPTVFAMAIISSFFFDNQSDMKGIIIGGGGWFVACIMIYYIVLWLIRRFMITKLNVAFGLSVLCVIAWFLFLEEDKSYNFMYGNTYFKWCHYFLFMLLGAMIGYSKQMLVFSLYKDLTKLALSVILYYGILYAEGLSSIVAQCQIVSLIPLLFATYYFYKCCNASQILKLVENKQIAWGIKCIATLTLEIYLIQSYLFTDKMNVLFPLNIPIMFIIILAGAYVVKVVARLFSQIFSEDKYDWKKMFTI